MSTWQGRWTTMVWIRGCNFKQQPTYWLLCCGEGSQETYDVTTTSAQKR